jgi:hypothetical protein
MYVYIYLLEEALEEELLDLFLYAKTVFCRLPDLGFSLNEYIWLISMRKFYIKNKNILD